MKAARSSTALRVLWWLSFAIFMLGLLWLGAYLWQTTSQQRSLDELSAYVRGAGDTPEIAPDTRHTANAPDAASADTDQETANATDKPLTSASMDKQATNAPDKTRTLTSTSTTKTASANIAPADSPASRYRALAAINPDFVGWIRIDGTRVDYPVMHSPASPERYLTSDFDRKYSFSGLPFLDALCGITDAPGNSILYGHNMRNGSMFADLLLYRDAGFLADHPTIAYDTLLGGGEYQIMAVFDMTAVERHEPSMLCYQTIDTDDEEAVAELNDYMDNYALLRGADARAQLGDRLLTLSTCSVMNSLQRLVVMARRVSYSAYQDGSI